MMALRSPGRMATAIGITVAAVAATVMAISVAQAAPTTAATNAKCTAHVNIRSSPKIPTAPGEDNKTGAACPTGTAVTIVKRENGFVQLAEYSKPNKPGWAKAEFVKEGASAGGAPAAGEARTTTTTSPAARATTSTAAAPGGAHEPAGHANEPARQPQQDGRSAPAADEPGGDEPAPLEEQEAAPARPSGIGGLLG